MRRSRWQFAVVTVVSMAGAANAAASDWLFNATGAGFAGWTDNVLNAPPPGEDPLGGPGAEEDLYTELRPGVLGSLATPKVIHNAVYQLVATAYAEHEEANSLQHRAGHLMLYRMSERTTINTQSFLHIGETNQFASGRPTDGGLPGVVPAGSQDFVELNLQDNLSYEPKREWRYSQTGQFRLMYSNANSLPMQMPNDTSTLGYELIAGGGVTRSWQDDAVSLEGAIGNLLFYASYDGDGRTSTQFNGTLTASWVHNLSESWSSRLFAGVSEIILVSGQSGEVTQPIGGGSVGYASTRGSIRAQASRQTGAELFIAQNTVTDTASLSGWLLLYQFAPDTAYDDTSAIGFSTSAGLGRYKLFGSDTGEFEGQAETMFADAGLAWQSRAYGIMLRYTYANQEVDEAVQRTSLLPYERNTFTVSVFGRFPERIGPVVPQRDPLRVQAEQEGDEGDERMGPRNERPGPF